MKFLKHLLLFAALTSSVLAQSVMYGTDPVSGKTFPLTADRPTKTLKVRSDSTSNISTNSVRRLRPTPLE
jgi:hypothetical protein